MRVLLDNDTGTVLEAEFFESTALLSSGSVDLCLMDLPYGTTANVWDAVIPPEPMWKELKRVCKSDAAIVLTAQTPFDKVLGASNLEMLRYEWIWDKKRPTGGLNSKKMPMKRHENVLVFYQRLPVYNPQMVEGTYYKATPGHKRSTNCQDQSPQPRIVTETSERYPVDILIFDRGDARTDLAHPTQKPVALFEYLIKTYSNEGQIVADFTAGSGTTALAARALKRNFIVADGDPFWAGEIVERLNAPDDQTWVKVAKLRRKAREGRSEVEDESQETA